MTILFWGLFAFFVAFCIHILVWKFRVPLNQTSWLLKIFLGTLLVIMFFLFISKPFLIAGISSPERLVDYLHIALFFNALAFAYIATYSALEVDSPTLIMIRYVAASGDRGAQKSQLFKFMNNDSMLKPRVKDLLSDKLAYEVAGKYKLTPRGSLVARVFVKYRNLLGLPKGG